MWTKVHQAMQVRHERRLQRDLMDLTDTEWILIEPWLPRPSKQGRRRRVDLPKALEKQTASPAPRWLVMAGQRISTPVAVDEGDDLAA
ncbi:hypothetical protein GBZ26_16030 [Azospirillum formosense]|uniref:Transposase n=1 Tax=Azospirillum formosense TaxID=861533 RepID=A0ABX2KY98_9PROT|nr:hypothetical protein [Azospirillum formosense]MBY3756805.1 hypothetical protein [Azospirillum formosense]NUB20704.1 hypothetical protein [Azospirillum formosense]